jgi:hypothetical protein
VQEAVASARASYHGPAAAGRFQVAHAGSRAVFAIKHVRRGRHVGGSQDRARDARSAVAQRRHGFPTSSYDSPDRETGGWEQMAVADRRTSVPDLAAFRIDFPRWLRTMTDRDPRIIVATALRPWEPPDLLRRRPSG